MSTTINGTILSGSSTPSSASSFDTTDQRRANPRHNEIIVDNDGSSWSRCEWCDHTIVLEPVGGNTARPAWVHLSSHLSKCSGHLAFVDATINHEGAPLDDAPVGPNVSEGDVEARYCTRCQHVYSGSFGEVIAAERQTFFQPGNSAGTSWCCDVCGFDVDVDIVDD